MANIRDVARHADVSVSTVSNVINGRTDQMRHETLLRIQVAMRELNYQPNRIAQQLKTGQVKMIGLLVPSIVNPSFAALAREIDLAAKAWDGYRVLLGNTYRQESEEDTFLEDMLAHGIKGVIVASSTVDKPHFFQAASQGLVMVNYDSRVGALSASTELLCDSVSMDNIEAGRIATEYLIQQGCRNLAFVTEASHIMSRSHKITGFHTAIAGQGEQVESQVIEGKASKAYGDTEMAELGRELARDVSALNPSPDGIVTVNDALAIGLIAGLRDIGIRVPEDISVVGIDNIPLAGLINPGLTSVMPPLAEMAALMIERLIKRIDDPKIKPEAFLFTPRLVIRDSVRKKK
ncbi:LacI family transcriptional regulator [[Pantoea] beijingensis]|uniref:LacI family transcriptional regulator n=1 Tax=[Pantoea] beijingensis TaxID=1324864 RepID=A0A443I8Z5_9GAMM|nr:LacI family DNA-binding transcriptional regulator [[Pantoea] beijingensis]RWR00651.1 LacI family transcriptional regulator [[Pantoea] beijingensis]